MTTFEKAVLIVADMKNLEDHHVALKAFTAFLIVSVAAVLFILFQRYSDKVFLDGNLEVFTVLSLIGGGLLLGLLYLVNKPHHSHTPKKKTVKRKKKK